MTPHDKQVMMFSATLASDMRTLCKKFMTNVRGDCDRGHWVKPGNTTSSQQWRLQLQWLGSSPQQATAACSTGAGRIGSSGGHGPSPLELWRLGCSEPWTLPSFLSSAG